MAAVGGDIVEITFNHPTLGSGVLFVKAAEDNTFDTGGYTKDDDSNSVTGNGLNIQKMNAKRWFFEGTVAWEMDGDPDTLSRIQALANDPLESEWTITHVNKTIWGGTGSPVGDIQANGNAATLTLKISGGGKMKKILG